MSLQTVVEDCLRGFGYELVELEWHAGGQLRVFIEHSVETKARLDGLADSEPGISPISEGPIPEDGSGIRIEDCERVSHQLSHLLTVENFDYSRLEVSSPGLDRAIRGRRDFERFVGSEITLKLKFAFAGRRNFEGLLCAGQDGQFELEVIDRPARAVAGKKVDGKVKGKTKAGSLAKRKPSQPELAPDQEVDGKLMNGEQAPLRLKFALDEIERARLVPKFKF